MKPVEYGADPFGDLPPLPYRETPAWCGLPTPANAGAARRAGWSGKEAVAVPSGRTNYAPTPTEPVTDEDLEGVTELLWATQDRLFEMRLRSGR